MKTIKQNEIYQHVSEFLLARGIEFKEGPYTHRIRQGCALLSDAINTAQQGLHKAKTQVGNKFDEMRQVIHEKTAPPAAKTTDARRKSAGTAPTTRQAGKPASRRPVSPKARKATRTPRPRKTGA